MSSPARKSDVRHLDAALAALRAGNRALVLEGVSASSKADSGRASASSLPVPQRLGVGSLSDRELQVLSLVADGHTNAAAGRKLGIAMASVKSHMTRVCKKLDANDRAEAVVIALREGAIV